MIVLRASRHTAAILNRKRERKRRKEERGERGKEERVPSRACRRRKRRRAHRGKRSSLGRRASGVPKEGRFWLWQAEQKNKKGANTREHKGSKTDSSVVPSCEVEVNGKAQDIKEEKIKKIVGCPYKGEMCAVREA